VSGREFRRFEPSLLQFLEELAENNNRAWFQENKGRYEQDVLEPCLAFIRAFRPRLRKISEFLVASDRRAGGSLMRVYRDTRFSKDKTPYKTQASVQFLRASACSDVHQPGFYVHLEPGECFAAAGIWAPDAATLTRVREAIVTRPAAWAPLSGLAFWGESYARPPKGVDPAHRFAVDLMRKHYLTWVDFKDGDVIGPRFVDRVERACLRMTPLVTFLDRALGLK
jgi:uncharacterized protein (TIGR02453 family)